MAKSKKVLLVTPPGTAAYAWFHKPDSGHQYSNNKYKGTLVLPGDTDMSDIEAKAKAVLAEAYPKADVDTAGMFFKSGDNHKNEEFRGTILLNASSKFAPQIVDAKRKPLPKGVEARSGDEVRFVLSLFPYESTEKVREGGKTVTVTVYGVSAQLQVVQVITKNSGGGGVNMLDEIDGFDASEDGGWSAGADDDTDDAGGDY